MQIDITSLLEISHKSRVNFLYGSLDHVSTVKFWLVAAH